MTRDYYDILGISQDASSAEIKRAFRQKAHTLHPDVNDSPEAVAEFQELQQAYAILSDPEKRALYDQGDETVEWEAQPQQQTTEYPTYHRRRAWNTFSKYDPAYGYVDTDYAHYARSITIIGIITLLFASTFLVDFFAHQSTVDLTVISVKNKGLQTGNGDDLSKVIIETNGPTFEKSREPKDELAQGEVINLRRSLIYGFKRYKRSSEEGFKRVSTTPLIICILAIVVYVFSLNAIFNKKKPERKFNAAIVAIFFSLMLLVFTLYA